MTFVIHICILAECAKHCSMCYNETECYECTQGYFLTEIGECQRKSGYSISITFIFVNLLIYQQQYTLRCRKHFV